MAFENLLVGTKGWDYKTWQGAFYPEDLPEGWRLDYYSNHFKCTLIPQLLWTEWDAEILEDIAEQLEDEAFYFYFEIDSCLSDSEVSKLTLSHSILGEKLFGIVFKHETQILPDNLNHLPVTLVSKKNQLTGWHWLSKDWIISGEPLGYIFELPDDGTAQSSLLQSYMASLPAKTEGGCFLIVEDDPNIKAVLNVKIVAEVLGY